MDFEAISDPLSEVDGFRKRAEENGLPLPEAMTLATVGADGRPHARVVLLRGRVGRELHFFTNYQSAKGRQLEQVPYAEVCIHYASLELQARVAGPVHKLSAAQSDAYFATRPRESQIGAWASHQSEPLRDRAELEERVREFEAHFAGEAVTRPPHWGGYAIAAASVELWVGARGRLHERAIYHWLDDAWQCQRLNP